MVLVDEKDGRCHQVVRTAIFGEIAGFLARISSMFTSMIRCEKEENIKSFLVGISLSLNILIL